MKTFFSPFFIIYFVRVIDIEQTTQVFYSRRCLSQLDILKNNKKRIWIWGGGTKGILFLKHLSNLRPLIFEKIVGVVDINPKKQLFFTPSTKIRIISDFQMYKESEEGDVVLVMNPNYYGEIVESIGSALSHTVEIHSI